MKLFTALFFAALLSFHANASSTVNLIHDCKNSMPDNTTSIHVQEAEFNDMHGNGQTLTTVSVSQSWLGGTYTSGVLGVNVIAAADGGPVVYVNEPMKFRLYVMSRGVNAGGRAAQVSVEGNFTDAASGREVTIEKTVLTCR